MSDAFSNFTNRFLSDIAASIGVSYEDLTKDFAAVAEAQAAMEQRAREKAVGDAIAEAAKLSIVSWHGEDEVDLDDPLVRGGVGGMWRQDPPWDEYLCTWRDPADRARLTRLKDHLVAAQVKRGGVWHQREGIPRFSDGSYLFLSMRAWGDLQAAVWGGHYCHFAWED